MEIIITPGQIWTGIIALCSALVTISAAIAVIVKAVSKAREPNRLQDIRIDALEEKVTRIEDRLQLGNKRFESDAIRVDSVEQNMKVTNKVIIESLQALIAHAIGDNNIPELKEVKKRLDEYLINKM